MKHRTNTDHIIPVSQDGVDKPINKREVDMNWHAALHRVFGNMPPHKRIYALLEWDSQIIQEVTLEEIAICIHEQVTQQQFYRPGVFNSKHRIPTT